jgi:hypothetical protein
MKTLLIAFSVAMGIMVVSGLAVIVHTAKSQAAIIEVFREQSMASNIARKELKLVDQKHLTCGEQCILQDYNRALHTITCSSCPSDFRKAWVDYTTAVQEASGKNCAAGGVEALVEFGMSTWTRDGRLTEEGLHGDGMADRLKIYLLQCEQIAVLHGVSFQPVEVCRAG